jgi:DNA-binding XRE family transcriptional regulator
MGARGGLFPQASAKRLEGLGGAERREAVSGKNYPARSLAVGVTIIGMAEENRTETAARFRSAREGAGLSVDDLAQAVGLTSANIWDLESYDNELETCYSPADLGRFSRVLRVAPAELIGGPTAEPSISAAELVERVHQRVSDLGISLEELEERVGWRLSAVMSPPQRLLEDINIDGLRWLCRELGIAWQRVIAGL